MKRSVLFFTLMAFFAIAGMIGGSGCANMIPPTGGPRDSLPPILMQVNPKDSTLGFQGKRITLNFNEYVQLDNIQENLLVSPTPKILPTVEGKLREVTITLRDTLEANTTYTLNFGNAIKDINEGNALKNFTYIFSTGNVLDSLTIEGNVIVAENGKSDSTLIVVLHKNFADSALKDRPRYVARLDGKGNFRFTNLPSDTYAIYAFKDEGGSRRFGAFEQLFAFADTLISSITPPKNFTLYAYPEPDTAKPIASRKSTAAKPVLKGNAAIADRILKVQTNLNNNQIGLLPSDTFQLVFPLDPLKTFDTTKIVFSNEEFQPINNYRWEQDTSRKKVSLYYKWAENTAYNLIFDKEFASDTSGRKIPRTDTLSFRAKKETDYGLVRIKIPNLDLSRNPVLLFVQNDGVVYSHPFGTSNQFLARLFNPGEYDLRILYDENKNGKWDRGSFFRNRRQPEKIVAISKKANIRGNIDNDIDITLDPAQ